MSNQPLKDFAKKYFDYLDRRDLDGLGTLFAPDVEFYGLAPQVLDWEGVRAAMTEFFTAFPDSRMPLDDIIADGDRVAMRHSFRGTHKAPFQGIPATDKSVVVTAIVTVKVKDGKVVEGWLNADIFGMLQQLGVIPQPSE
jgi:steroid delta-isomerase-like uncharacterized protein